ncbi:MAG: hypothetical protein K2Q28_03245 [Hyphomicrobium sp.]|nr:hypothetical protein [Hyphomicrobium sp.]
MMTTLPFQTQPLMRELFTPRGVAQANYHAVEIEGLQVVPKRTCRIHPRRARPRTGSAGKAVGKPIMASPLDGTLHRSTKVILDLA